MDERVKRAQTEALFREVNERIADSAAGFHSAHAEFVCECSDPECTDLVEATLDQYKDVRRDGATFMVVPGHQDLQIERVIERRPRLAVIQKVERVVAGAARRLDPRARSR